MTKTVVVLGAGLAGVPTAHYLLSHISQQVSDLRVVLVAPNDEFYWSLASVRAGVPGQIPDDKLFWSIPKLFAKYSSSRFEFVAGKAETLDPDNNSVVVALNDDGHRTVSYHTVVVATGSDAKENMPWKNLGTSQQTHAALDQLRSDIKNAESIVVGGAGSTGVEFAGELGSEYAKSGKKSISIISSESLPLEDRLMKGTRVAAKKELEKLHIKVITDTKITKITTEPSGRKVLELTKKDGSKQTLRTDLFVPTYGMTYNTQFAPAKMLDASGRLNQDIYLRAPGYDNVFVLGDAGNLQTPQAGHVDAQVRHLAKQFAAYLSTGKVVAYAPDDKIMFAVTVGRDRGTGQMGTMKPFSLLIWFFKGRFLGTNYASEYAAGSRLLTGKW